MKIIAYVCTGYRSNERVLAELTHVEIEALFDWQSSQREVPDQIRHRDGPPAEIDISPLIEERRVSREKAAQRDCLVKALEPLVPQQQKGINDQEG